MEQIDWEKAQKIFEKDKQEILGFLQKESGISPRIKDILLILAAGTLISAVFIMPGLPLAFGPFLWEGKGYKKNRFKQALKRLHAKKLVQIAETKDGPVVRITKNGMTKALKYKLDEMKVEKRGNWDKKWRIVIFDIPEHKKKLRDLLRERLKQLGFYTLQESVYVHAFSCSDEVEFLRQIYGVDIEVTFILADKIEGQENLTTFFGLS